MTNKCLYHHGVPSHPQTSLNAWPRTRPLENTITLEKNNVQSEILAFVYVKDQETEKKLIMYFVSLVNKIKTF